ncbi:hypothetical protein YASMINEVIRUS_440 [Yasminevirus sp. GU-2018]|uniref:Uncharacterized protein n=1 Tax=Yasminevirus sp. GU-2018 TaxID=2420051 RepID=A0A5K0U814_9VIRU|nr:hypothetical protein YASMINEVIRUS_440 [Yasminevirus sp. GU-2018]
MLILYTYYLQESQHRYQLAKIKALEYKYSVKSREIEELKTRSQSCPVPNLNDPRSCYFGSNYACSWNDMIGRCDLIT